MKPVSPVGSGSQWPLRPPWLLTRLNTTVEYGSPGAEVGPDNYQQVPNGYGLDGNKSIGARHSHLSYSDAGARAGKLLMRASLLRSKVPAHPWLWSHQQGWLAQGDARPFFDFMVCPVISSWFFHNGSLKRPLPWQVPCSLSISVLWPTSPLSMSQVSWLFMSAATSRSHLPILFMDSCTAATRPRRGPSSGVLLALSATLQMYSSIPNHD